MAQASSQGIDMLSIVNTLMSKQIQPWVLLSESPPPHGGPTIVLGNYSLNRIAALWGFERALNHNSQTRSNRRVHTHRNQAKEGGALEFKCQQCAQQMSHISADFLSYWFDNRSKTVRSKVLQATEWASKNEANSWQQCWPKELGNAGLCALTTPHPAVLKNLTCPERKTIGFPEVSWNNSELYFDV